MGHYAVFLYSAASSLWFKAAAAEWVTGEKTPLGSFMSGFTLQHAGDPYLLRTEVTGDRRRGRERRLVWLCPNGASCGYSSNTDYYVVLALTLMGCYNDLKWFNGSQVGAPNGPLYTPMRIMNGNDSVVKCLCFSCFSLSFLAAAQSAWQVSLGAVIGLQTAQWVNRWSAHSSGLRSL